MFKEVSVIDSINVLADGQIQVRRSDKVFRNEIEIANVLHRHVISPGDDLQKEDARVIMVAKAVWTPEVIEAYQKSIAKAEKTIQRDESK